MLFNRDVKKINGRTNLERCVILPALLPFKLDFIQKFDPDWDSYVDHM